MRQSKGPLVPLSLPAPARQTTQLRTSDYSLHISAGGSGGGGNEERAPYLEIALRWKDNMTHQFMSKELILTAYSISNFLPRLRFLKEIIILFSFLLFVA